MTTQENHQNVHGQKITVKYYVEKSVKPHIFFWDGKKFDGYPIYLRVIVKKQSTKLKSCVDAYVPPEKLSEYLSSEYVWRLVQDEIEEISRTILKAKPFDNEQFKLSKVLQVFSDRKYATSYLVGNVLLNEYLEARLLDLSDIFREEYEKNPTKPWMLAGEEVIDNPDIEDPKISIVRSQAAEVVFGRTNEFTPQNVFSILRVEANPSSPRVHKILLEYGLPLLRLLEYEEIIRLNALRLPSFNTFLTKEFDQIFLEYCDDETALLGLRKGFAQLAKNHSYIAQLVENWMA